MPDAAGAARDAAPLDGSVDAVPPDAALKGWCDGKMVTFCADFDGVQSAAEGWTSTELSAGASLELAPLASMSAARTLRARVPAGSSPNSTTAMVKKGVSSTLGHTVLEFDCKVSSIGTAAGEWLLQIARLSHNGSDDGLALYAHSTGTWAVLVVVGKTVVGGLELPAAPEYGRFVRISLDVLWSPTSGGISIAYDGQGVIAQDGLVTALEPTTNTVDLAIGLSDSLGSTPAADMSYDNVTLQQR
jgi:hypothetical protein